MHNTRVPAYRYRAVSASLALVLSFVACGVGARADARGPVPGDWAVVGNAVDEDGYFLLTSDTVVQVGAVWQRDQVDLRDGFDRTFVLSFGDDDMNGADGIVFVLQQAGLEAVGGNGQGIGYAGITPSIGVELDTFQNGGDPIEDHIAVDENGSVAHDGLPAIPLANLEDGQEHVLRVVWKPAATELAVDLDGARTLVYTKDLVADIFGGDPLVYLGFTAGTGGSHNAQYVRMATPPALLSWSAPVADGLAPPTDLTGTGVGLGAPTPTGTTETPEGSGSVIAYHVYRSSDPNVAIGPDTLFAVLPPDTLTVRAPLGAAGSHFVVTAVTGTGESAPSNEVALGVPGASLAKVKAKGPKITARGSGFTDTVRVFLDGIAFREPATVKKRKRVIQKGLLDTGDDLAAYLTKGRTVTITFVNDDESVVSITQTVR